MNNSQIKAQARERLSGNYGKPLQILFLSFLLSFLSELIVQSIFENEPIVSLIITIALIPINYGIAVFFLDFTRYKEVDASMLFIGYKDFGKIFTMEILMGIYVLLWSLLLVIPGIIKSIAYSMSHYILYDNPEMTASEAIKFSEEIMDGRKMDFFKLQLSFIGWILLGIPTFGLLYIWLNPYINTSITYFYEETLRRYKNKSENMIFQ